MRCQIFKVRPESPDSTVVADWQNAPCHYILAASTTKWKAKAVMAEWAEQSLTIRCKCYKEIKWVLNKTATSQGSLFLGSNLEWAASLLNCVTYTKDLYSRVDILFFVCALIDNYIRQTNKVHNIIDIILQLKYYNSNMFRPFLDYLQTSLTCIKQVLCK